LAWWTTGGGRAAGSRAFRGRDPVTTALMRKRGFIAESGDR